MSSSGEITDDGVRRLADSVRTLVWTLQRFGEREAGLTGLSQSEIEVLRILFDHPGATVSDVARLLGLQSSNVSATVRSMTQRGLVTRTANPRDRRSYHLHRTALAERNGDMIRHMWTTGVRRLLSEIDPDDAAALVDVAPLLERLTRLSDERPVPAEPIPHVGAVDPRG
ncbi:MarR family winged helix-turn-helix transcriptional regulator [Rhodococcus chondri]|uniref:MarR family transcriptional regulator n=1 Tax=Rhodococcus chondri TaxID=3065941 RepID=A0ABU7JQ99_9NOCA|nr:MarR family transcriptional regulator [Rhodococcus sp. CC-R104]MEE2032005.1 MarR family transcriptional regulator [Rhodococcus sp. CC-R104]